MNHETILRDGALMTIKTVSEALGVSRDLIEKRVKELYPDKMKRGKTTYLNIKEVTAIKLRISQNSSIATSDDRRKLSQMPKTDLEKELIIQQAMLFQAEKIAEMQQEINILKPKAALADKAIRDENEHYSITEAGKHLGLRRKEIFDILRSKGMLTQENLPTQKAIDMGVLELRTNPECNGRNRQQAIMKMKHIERFNSLYCKD